MDSGTEKSAPLLPSDTIIELTGAFGASFTAGVFSLSSTTIITTIMSLPMVIKILGVIPGIMSLLLLGVLTKYSINILLRFGDDGRAFTYAHLMEDMLGRVGKVLLQISFIISRTGICIIYLIILTDVISGSDSSGVHHSGVLEEWFGEHWWTGRAFVLFTLAVLLLMPTAWLRMDHSLPSIFALVARLAAFAVFIFMGITLYKLVMGTVHQPVLFPSIGDPSSFWNLFTAIPVLFCSYLCHLNVFRVQNEIGDPLEMQGVVKSSLILCSLAYLVTGLCGYLLFGDSVTSDLLSNFDSYLKVPISSVLSALIRLSYSILIVLVFPVIFSALRFDVDELIFNVDTPLGSHYMRYTSITYGLFLVILLGALYVPNIWALLQFIGITAGTLMLFIFPASIVLRDRPLIATRKDKVLSWSLLTLSVSTSLVATYSNVASLF